MIRCKTKYHVGTKKHPKSLKISLGCPTITSSMTMITQSPISIKVFKWTIGKSDRRRLDSPMNYDRERMARKPVFVRNPL